VGWPSPPGGPCARPPPGMAYPKPSTVAPLVLHSPPLVPPRLPLRGSTNLFLWMRSSAPLPRYSPSRSTAAAIPFQIEQMVAESSRGRRGGGGIEQRTARRQRNRAEDSEEEAESTRRRRNRGSVSLSIRRQGAALPPKASLEHPDA
jgi:hypothetical protein